jgi:hypothetical protein
VGEPTSRSQVILYNNPIKNDQSSDIIHYIDEAIWSYKIILDYIGKSDSPANYMLLKWPEMVISYIKQDKEAYMRDLAYLICVPFKVLAEALCDYLTQVDINEFDKITPQIIVILVDMNKDPLGTRSKMIKLCNELIHKLRLSGKMIQLIPER